MSVVPRLNGKKVYEIYSPNKTYSNEWDVIVIGSGMGGMSCAAALAKSDKRVLVLEQHYIPGGFTHSYARKGFQWDAGVHAVGEMAPGDTPRKFLDWLTDGKVEMLSLGNPYDRFIFSDGQSIKYPNTKKAFIANLKENFPGNETKLDRYFKLVDKAAKASLLFFAFKTLPESLDKVLNRAVGLFSRNFWNVTTSQILDECQISGDLRDALTVHWGYYGSTPEHSSFSIHALIHAHFWKGAYYPKGSSRVLAENLLGQVLKSGGQIICEAPVKEILINNNRATGVQLDSGHVFRAPIIVSAAGAKTTVNHLLPTQRNNNSNLIRWINQINQLKNSPPYICLNLGFEGDITEDGARPSNLWLFGERGHQSTYWNLADPKADPHVLYISFPSLKDSEHEPGPKMRHTGECVTFVDWKLFEKWQNMTEDREANYLLFKESIQNRILAKLRQHIPKVMEKLVYCELSTPITTRDFTGANQGAIYGLEATPARFGCSALRTRTPIKGLYMTGVDVASLGVVGAMSSGMLTAATICPKLYLKLL